MKKAIVIPAHLISKFQQQTNYVNKRESKMDRIERQLDSILKNKKLNIYDKRDLYLQVLQELFDERDRLGEDLEIEINDPSQSILNQTSQNTLQNTSQGGTFTTPHIQNTLRRSTFTLTPSRLTPIVNRTLSQNQSFSTPPQYPNIPHASTPISVDPHIDLLNKQLTKYTLGKGISLYNKLLQHKLTGGGIGWDVNGEVTIRGNTIQNSNIVALILRAVCVRGTKIPPSEGFDEFAHYIIATIPKNLWGYNIKNLFNKQNSINALRAPRPSFPTTSGSSPIAHRTRERKLPLFGRGGLWIPY